LAVELGSFNSGTLSRFQVIHELLGKLAVLEDVSLLVFSTAELLVAEIARELLQLEMNGLVVTVILRLALTAEPHLAQWALHGDGVTSFELVDWRGVVTELV
jgi:hypothetical protein